MKRNAKHKQCSTESNRVDTLIAKKQKKNAENKKKKKNQKLYQKQKMDIGQDGGCKGIYRVDSQTLTLMITGPGHYITNQFTMRNINGPLINKANLGLFSFSSCFIDISSLICDVQSLFINPFLVQQQLDVISSSTILQNANTQQIELYFSTFLVACGLGWNICKSNKTIPK